MTASEPASPGGAPVPAAVPGHRAADPIVVVPMTADHAAGVLAVYAEGIATGDATFETEVPSWAHWDAARLPDHRFVAVHRPLPGTGLPDAALLDVDPLGADRPGADRPGADRPVVPEPDVVLGWVAVSQVSPRAAYAGVVEHGVYVAAAARGRGVATALVRRLVDSCDAAGIWTIQSGVLAENTASLALHERLGFRRVGVRERIGRRDGRWRDVVLLERRSAVAGR